MSVSLKVVAIIALYVICGAVAVGLNLLAVKILLIIRNRSTKQNRNEIFGESSDYCYYYPTNDREYYVDAAITSSVLYVLVTLINLIF